MTAEITPDVYAGFLRAGGVMTLGDWLNLDTDTQTALADIGNMIAVERICAAARAMSGIEGYLDIHSNLDDGWAREEALLSAALTKGAGMLRGTG